MLPCGEDSWMTYSVVLAQKGHSVRIIVKCIWRLEEVCKCRCCVIT